MRIIYKGSKNQLTEKKNKLTFTCSCGCRFEADTRNREACLCPVETAKYFSQPVVFAYVSTCPECGNLVVHGGEPITCCC